MVIFKKSGNHYYSKNNIRVLSLWFSRPPAQLSIQYLLEKYYEQVTFQITALMELNLEL